MQLVTQKRNSNNKARGRKFRLIIMYINVSAHAYEASCYGLK